MERINPPFYHRLAKSRGVSGEISERLARTGNLRNFRVEEPRRGSAGFLNASFPSIKKYNWRYLVSRCSRILLVAPRRRFVLCDFSSLSHSFSFFSPCSLRVMSLIAPRGKSFVYSGYSLFGGLSPRTHVYKKVRLAVACVLIALSTQR